MVASATVQLRGLGKKAMTELERKAKSMGMTPERYLRELVEEDLQLDRKARSMTFAEIMGLGQDVDENELDQLVEAARTRYHKRVSKKR
jgi:hypothetical protein